LKQLEEALLPDWELAANGKRPKGQVAEPATRDLHEILLGRHHSRGSLLTGPNRQLGQIRFRVVMMVGERAKRRDSLHSGVDQGATKSVRIANSAEGHD